MTGTFRIAGNPEPDSTLPYVLWVPLAQNPLVLKAKDTWPRTVKVYCHRGAWPDDAEIVEEVGVRSCTRRGVAIDLVVERKKLQEIAGNVVDGSLLLTLGELATARRAAIVVEDRWADVCRLDHVSPSMVAETRRRPGAIPDRADHVLRDPSARPGVDLPVPRRCRGVRRRGGRRPVAPPARPDDARLT